jgi:hypothetical protein
MLLLIAAALNLASNEGAASVCVFVAGALVTRGEVPELVSSDCWACASDGKRCAAAIASAAVVAKRWHLVGNRVRFSRITDWSVF